MKEAVDKVKRALSRQDIVSQLTHYSIKDGFIYAGDGRYVACAPIDCDQNFIVAGKEFERLVARLPSIDKVVVTDKDVTLRSARAHGSIKTLPAEMDGVLATPGPVWNEPPPRLLDALETVRPFISDNAVHQFALCACLGRDSIVATTNVSLIKVDCPSLDGSGQLLPLWAIDHILSRKDNDLVGIQIYPEYASFKWDDDSWIRTQLINGEFPSVAVKLFEKYEDPEWEIPADWREAFEFLVDLAGDWIAIGANKMISEKDASKVEHEIPSTPVPLSEDMSRWSTKFLEPVIKIATHWNLQKYPQPAEFKAQGVQGFIIGRRG